MLPQGQRFGCEKPPSTCENEGHDCCLLWIVKARAKDKNYIWISVRWKAKKLNLRNLQAWSWGECTRTSLFLFFCELNWHFFRPFFTGNEGGKRDWSSGNYGWELRTTLSWKLRYEESYRNRRWNCSAVVTPSDLFDTLVSWRMLTYADVCVCC
jgi:hypothetical protein